MNDSNRGRIILYLTLVPSVILIIVYFATIARDRWFSTSGIQITVKAKDALEIHGQWEGSANPDRTVILIPDPSLDREFNSRAVKSNTGNYLARAILESKPNTALIRYDQRGTGRSPGDSRMTSLEMLAEDLVLFALQAKGRVTIVAHGDSCATALFAKQNLKVDQWVFVSCAYSGTLLENWGARFFQNMENSGVDKKTIARCMEEWIVWNRDLSAILKAKERPAVIPAKDGDSPDLLIFREALRELSWERREWTREAATFRVLKSIQELNNISIFWPEYDLVIPAVDRNVMAGSNLAPSIRILPRTEFFLLETDRGRKALVERVLFFKSPFTHVNEEAVKTIAASIR
ncbi:MAG: alpha/beta hydrolase [Spirochaetia bacterium]|nr:alpha/beta hydrolase [Spirochaetia bacterium]